MRRLPQLTEHVYLVGSGQLGLSHNLDCNVYLLSSNGEYALVDAGAGVGTEDLVDNVCAILGDISILRYLLLTHCHGDHAGGVGSLKEVSTVKVVTSPFENEMLERGSAYEIGLTQAKYAGTYPADYIFRNAPGDIVLNHGDKLRLGDLEITALITPGHTKGSTCFLVTGSGPSMLFTGDTIYWGGLISLLNTPGSEISDYRSGVQALEGLAIECLFPGHGMWTVRNGQAHIDKLLEYFRRSGVPPMPQQIEKVHT
jgi:glyoxylase-like metal-dependent hydrolase (beta-lactamase superfamily II)